MEKKLFIKLRTIEEGTNRNRATARMEYPHDFSEILKKAEDFVKISNPNEIRLITDEKSHKTITSQEEYEELPSSYNDGETIKLHVTKINRNLSSENNNKENPTEKLKNDLQNLVHKNLQSLENSLVETIFESIKNPLNESLIKKPNQNQNEIIHHGIECNECHMKEIKGIRYKCLNCENYNLCSSCEYENVHDPSHILIKIRKSIENESEFESKVKNTNLKYKNTSIKFQTEFLHQEFQEFDEKQKPIKCEFFISLKNSGNETLEKGWSFKCLKDISDLEGNDYNGENDLNINETLKIKLDIDDLQEQLRFFEDYKIYYQLFNKNDEALGSIAKFQIKIKSDLRSDI